MLLVTVFVFVSSSLQRTAETQEQQKETPQVKGQPGNDEKKKKKKPIKNKSAADQKLENRFRRCSVLLSYIFCFFLSQTRWREEASFWVTSASLLVGVWCQGEQFTEGWRRRARPADEQEEEEGVRAGQRSRVLGDEEAEAEGRQTGGGLEEEEDGVCGQPALQLHQEGFYLVTSCSSGQTKQKDGLLCDLAFKSFHWCDRVVYYLFRRCGASSGIKDPSSRSGFAPWWENKLKSGMLVRLSPACSRLIYSVSSLQVREDSSVSRKVAAITYVDLGLL